MPQFRHLLGSILLGLLAGCNLMSSSIDREIRELSARVESPPPAVADVLPAAPPPLPSATGEKALLSLPAPAAPVADTRIGRVSFQEKKAPPPRRLVIPADLLGSDAPPLKWPEPDTPEGRERFLKEIYPELPPLPPLPPAAPGPEGHPLCLADLQRLAALYSPAIKNAEAAVVAAEGAAKQAGLYPNPSFFFEHDTVQTGPAGYPGFGVDQVIKTGNKLKLQQAVATMDVLNAKVALRKAHADLRYQVRQAYFGVLVALETVRVGDALYRFADDIYRYQIGLLRGGFAAAYEPMQLRPLVLQAKANVLQARNQYQASWKQLVAAMGLPCMPPSELEGRVDLPVPVFDYHLVEACALKNHTDVLTASNSIQKAHYALALAKIIPWPDVDVRFFVQKDYTTPPNQVAHSVNITVPVPLWDRNQGNIHQAEGLLAQALVGPDQARNSLITTLADAYSRYSTARQLVDIAQQQIRDQVRAYRGAFERRDRVPAEVGFGDLVTAQQTLATYITGYITALGQQWTAVVDVANLLQTEDLFQTACHQEMAPIPELPHFAPPAEPKGQVSKAIAPALEAMDTGPKPAIPSTLQAVEANLHMTPIPSEPAGVSVNSLLLTPPPVPPSWIRTKAGEERSVPGPSP